MYPSTTYGTTDAMILDDLPLCEPFLFFLFFSVIISWYERTNWCSRRTSEPFISEFIWVIAVLHNLLNLITASRDVLGSKKSMPTRLMIFPQHFRRAWFYVSSHFKFMILLNFCRIFWIIVIPYKNPLLKDDHFSPYPEVKPIFLIYLLKVMVFNELKKKRIIHSTNLYFWED